MKMVPTIVSLATVISCLMLSYPAKSQITHYDSASGYTEPRSANYSALSNFTVSSAKSISSFGINLDLAGNGNLRFYIYSVNGNSGTMLYQSGSKLFIDDGQTYKYSDPFSFTFNPGTTYSIGASSDVATTIRYDLNANSVNGFNFSSTNGNLQNGGFSCCGGVDVDSALVIAGAAPEPGAWLLMIVGFGIVGYAMRRRKVSFGSTPVAGMIAAR